MSMASARTSATFHWILPGPEAARWVSEKHWQIHVETTTQKTKFKNSSETCNCCFYLFAHTSAWKRMLFQASMEVNNDRSSMAKNTNWNLLQKNGCWCTVVSEVYSKACKLRYCGNCSQNETDSIKQRARYFWDILSLCASSKGVAPVTFVCWPGVPFSAQQQPLCSRGKQTHGVQPGNGSGWTSEYDRFKVGGGYILLQTWAGPNDPKIRMLRNRPIFMKKKPFVTCKGWPFSLNCPPLKIENISQYWQPKWLPKWAIEFRNENMFGWETCTLKDATPKVNWHKCIWDKLPLRHWGRSFLAFSPCEIIIPPLSNSYMWECTYIYIYRHAKHTYRYY